MEEQDIYKKALKLWGNRNQEDMMIGESAELTHAIVDYRRGKAKITEVIEEMVDVQITLDQMKIRFNELEMYERLMKYKLTRLQKLVESDLVGKNGTQPSTNSLNSL